MPATAEELARAVDGNTLPHETATYEYKAELPNPSKNHDIAVDAAAMATAGGVVIYGVLENKKEMTFSETPIHLAGVKDRISDVVSSQVHERPYFEVRLLPFEDDPLRGFVLVEIPASARAPHMVEVKGQYRFYGRVPGGNQILTEAQVAFLYERRERVERNAESALDAAIALVPVESSEDRCDLHLVAHPLVPDKTLRDRVFPDSDLDALHDAVMGVHRSLLFANIWDPSFGEILNGVQRERTLEGVALYNPPFDSDDGLNANYVARLEVLDGGTTRYFRAAVGSEIEGRGRVIRDPAVAQIAARFAHFSGRFLSEASYHGAVDLAIAVTNTKGAVSQDWWNSPLPVPRGALPSLPMDEFRNHLRIPVAHLLDEPRAVAAELVGGLLRVIRPDRMANRFPDPLLPSASSG